MRVLTGSKFFPIHDYFSKDLGVKLFAWVCSRHGQS